MEFVSACSPEEGEVSSLVSRLPLLLASPHLSLTSLASLLGALEDCLARGRQVLQDRQGEEGGQGRVNIKMHRTNEAEARRPEESLLKDRSEVMIKTDLEVVENDVGMMESGGEEEEEAEIDIVVEEDGHIIKISPEELNKLRSEFEENRSVELKEELKDLEEDEETEEEEEDRRYNLDPQYAGRTEHAYLCKVCDLAVSSRRGLEGHMGVSHPGLAVFRCAQCHNTFASDVGLILHMQNKHPGPSAPLLSCSEPACSYTTLGKQLLRAHMREHQLNSVLQCPVCHKEYVG